MVCLRVDHDRDSCKTAEPLEMPFGIYRLGCMGPGNRVSHGGAHERQLANTIKRFVLGGDADCCYR